MKTTLTALAISILIAACGQPEPPPPNLEATVQTMVHAALPTQTPTGASADIAVAVATGVAATVAALPTTPPTPTATLQPPPTHTATPTPVPTALPTTTPTPPSAPTPTPTLAQMVEGIAPGLVYIETSTGSGSGFIIDADGLVVTNAHVVERFDSVNVALADGSEYRGSVLGVDEIADLALLRLQSPRRFDAMQLGNSDGIQVGDDVIALGFPLRYELGNSPTVTRGIISSKRLANGVEELQTDAAINPGNSGGPLVDRHGSVIGVNYAELPLSDGNPVDNIGFSVAINELKSRMAALANGDNTLLPTPTPGVWTEYRNEDFGYAIDIAPGWRLDEETADGGASFWNEDRTAYLEAFIYDLAADVSLTEFAEYVRDDLTELAQADAWDVFEITDFVGVQRAGDQYYWLEYRWRSSDEYCVSRDVELIILSSRYPTKPYGFNIVGGVCEHSYDYYGEQVNDMVGSLSDWATQPSAVAPTPTPEPWTQYRNDDFGYAIDIPPGWRLEDETAEGDATFGNEDFTASLDVFVFDISQTDFTLADFAQWRRDDLTQIAESENWDVFETVNLEQGDGAFYWLTYRWVASSDAYCVSRDLELLILSARYPAVPYGFSVAAGICEDNIDAHADIVADMIASFVTY